ncbi:MAG: hypothetical protein ACK5XN_35285, partial [Bacteroidota bacterium]
TYNQSVLLCNSLSKIFKAQTNHFAFKKNQNTSQLNKNFLEREINSKSIEISDISQIINKNVCVVDDLVASGSTINRCCNLISPYVKSVFFTTIAKS